jgi:dienelactone hydrolase
MHQPILESIFMNTDYPVRFPRPSTRRHFVSGLAVAAVAKALLRAGEPVALPTVGDEIRRAAAVAPLRLTFSGRTREELLAWQKEFAAELKKRIGDFEPPRRWSSKPLSRVELADHVREEWLLESDGIASLPLYVLVPAAARHGRGPFPIVIALHGHSAFGHDSVVGIDHTEERRKNIRDLNYDYGRQLVREGFLVVAPCMTPFGRRLDGAIYKSDPCAITLVRMLLLGQTLMGANLRDVKWAVSHAQTRPDVRPEAVGCVGLSTGGRMTMLTTALDERIKVAVVSGALNVMQERIEAQYSCGAQVIPGLLEIGDTPEIGSLIAPRPCIWEAGSRDPLLKPKWMEVAKTRLRRAYAAAGVPDNVQFLHFEGAHVWNGTTALPLLRSVLAS